MIPSLELAAMRFLRFQKRCCVILTERSPREQLCGRPDVLGITKSRYLIEIEIKRSKADFLADRYKKHRETETRNCFLSSHPRQFYYLVPRVLLDIVSPLTPEWAGLLGQRKYGNVVMVKPSPLNSKSRRLSTKEVARHVHLLSNQMISMMEMAENWRARFAEGWDSQVEDNYQI